MPRDGANGGKSPSRRIPGRETPPLGAPAAWREWPNGPRLPRRSSREDGSSPREDPRERWRPALKPNLRNEEIDTAKLRCRCATRGSRPLGGTRIRWKTLQIAAAASASLRFACGSAALGLLAPFRGHQNSRLRRAGSPAARRSLCVVLNELGTGGLRLRGSVVVVVIEIDSPQSRSRFRRRFLPSSLFVLPSPFSPLP